MPKILLMESRTPVLIEYTGALINHGIGFQSEFMTAIGHAGLANHVSNGTQSAW